MYTNNENENNQGLTNRKNGMSCLARDFASDDDSRDSGVADMDCGLPTTFEPTPQQIRVLDLEMDELVIKEAKLSISERKTLSQITNRPRAFTDITNSPRTIESPKSRKASIGFARPFARTQSQFSRKRANAEIFDGRKRSRAEKIDEEAELAPSCSGVIAPRPILHMHRTHSTSVLERGNYAHFHEEVPHTVEVSYHLPTVTTNDSQAFKRIASSTLHDLMLSMESSSFHEKYMLIDCRYPYEYEGGHIRNALNIYNPAVCEELFFPKNGQLVRRIPIFYCEYSQKRGPSMANALRSEDRKINELQYPKVDYEEIYVLDKGYKGFFETHEKHRRFCEPSQYIAMDDKRFSAELKKYNHHKKGMASTTCLKPSGARSRILFRQMSADSPSPRSSRRLFSHHESAPVALTPERSALAPIAPPQFS